MSNGILCFANNNGKIDYLKQAIFLANRAKQYLNLPVSIATSSKRDLDYLYKEQASIFDHIIEIPDVLSLPSIISSEPLKGSPS